MTAPLSVGSLCSGYGGLELAAAGVLDVAPVWVADPAPGAAAVLAHRFPGVPNLGDLTAVDFRQVPRVDVVCAGFPCQDLSSAGRGAGIREGTRSGLWYVIAAALGVLRPRFVVLENVRAIVARRPGLDRVLADLARLGFDAEWTCVRASDVGAPHRRERWFLLAWPADAPGPRLQGARLPGRPAVGGGAATDTDGVGGDRTATQHRAHGWAVPAGDAAPDAARIAQREPADPPHTFAGSRQARPEPCGRGVQPSADADRDRREVLQRQQPGVGTRNDVDRCRPASRIDWGAYAPAIDRWARVIGRSAPPPRLPTGRHGADQLNPVFVEWLMGLPDGWVTAVPDLSRNQQLALLGNGVVPSQGSAALAVLFARLAARRALDEGTAA